MVGASCLPGVVSIVQWCILGLGAGAGVLSVLVLLVALWERFGERKLALQGTIAFFGGCLGVVQLIPLLNVWGFSSVQSSGDNVYALCRVYLTLCFSLLPMVHWTVVCLLLQSLYKYRIQCDESLRASRNHTRSHLYFGAFISKVVLFSLPSIASVALVSWIDLAFYTNNTSVVGEQESRTVLEYFFQPYIVWASDTQGSQCIMCVFPASVVILHGIFVCLYVLYMWRVTMRIRKVVINVVLKKKLVFHAAVSTACLILGLASVACTFAVNLYSHIWIFQALYIAFIVISIVIQALITYCVWILHPLYEHRRAAKSRPTSADSNYGIGTPLSRVESRNSSKSMVVGECMSTVSAPSSEDGSRFSLEAMDCVPVGRSLSATPSTSSSVHRARDVLLSPHELAELHKYGRRRQTSSAIEYDDEGDMEGGVDLYREIFQSQDDE